MLKLISWSDYFSTLTLLFIGYYLIVLYVFFKWDILKRLGITKVDNSGISAASLEPELTQTKNASEEREVPDAGETDLAPIIQSYTDEVTAFLEEAAESKIVKEEILFALQQISAKYWVVYEADTKEGVVLEIYRLTIRQFPNLLTLDEIRPYLVA